MADGARSRIREVRVRGERWVWLCARQIDGFDMRNRDSVRLNGAEIGEIVRTHGGREWAAVTPAGERSEHKTRKAAIEYLIEGSGR